jgi:hypothetical protein
MTDLSDALDRFLGVLDRLEIPYLLGGSGASSCFGLWRATADLDFVVDCPAEKVPDLVALLQHDFYIDEDHMRQSWRLNRASNAIHKATAFKFDLFPLEQDTYQQQQFLRRRFMTMKPFGEDEVELAISTPEDVILNKLRWYRLGGESSQQQLRDALGVLQAQRGRLDFEYLRKWAAYLKLEQLLERLLTDQHHVD